MMTLIPAAARRVTLTTFTNDVVLRFFVILVVICLAATIWQRRLARQTPVTARHHDHHTPEDPS